MRPVKRVLLGSAAGIFAVAGAQAADLPVKAKPAEYVRVCSLYGAGFWYVPGTDTCIKIGAFTKLDLFYGASGSGAPLGGGNAFQSPGNFAGAFDRTTNMFNTRATGTISFDMRTQTEYGTLRSYIDVGATTASQGGGFGGGAVFQPLGNNYAFGAQAIYSDRAFVQFAGITAGRIRSFFDMFNPGAYSLAQQRMSGDTSPVGIAGMAYTWQFGGGFSASLSLEDNGWTTGGRGRSTVNLAGGGSPVGESDGSTPFGIGGAFFNDVKGQQMLDPVLNLRLDQAWGFVGASFALHDASGGYYGCAPPGVTGPQQFPGANPTFNSPCFTGTPVTGVDPYTHPADKWGWASSVGFTWVNPFGLAGDSVGAQAVYSEGAIGYNTSNFGPSFIYGSGNNVGMSFLVDGVFNSGTGVELTHNWSFIAAYEHIWTPQWRTSIYGGMLGTDFAGGTSLICPGGSGAGNPLGFTNFASGTPGTFGNQPGNPEGVFNGTNPATFKGGGGNSLGVNTAAGGTVVSHCDPNSSWTQLGTRTMWNPVPDIDIGFDVSWLHLNTAFAGLGNLNPLGTLFQPGAGGRPGGIYNIDNQDVFAAYFRIQRNFLY
jgi:hypothetical protein